MPHQGMPQHRPPPPVVEPRLSEAAAEAWIPRTCFKHGPPERLGVELELLVRVVGEPGRATDGPAYDPWRAAALRLPTGGRVTLEPGGQLEISSPPADDLATCLAVTADDLRLVRGLAARHGLELVGAGFDPREVGRRVLTDPRYTAMERYLDRWGPAGRTMMRRTASVQVNLEAGADATSGAHRWDLLHTVGPPLVAAFANSPGPPGPWAGWASSRLGVWLQLDPARTGRPVAAPGEAHTAAWARWCLDAPLMLVRRTGDDWAPPPGATFRDWLVGAEEVVPDRGAPSVHDLAYHLTTLFPPVRARGHLEVRYLDALPDDWWQVPVAVLWVLTVDQGAAAAATAAAAPHRERWRDAARHGMRDDGLAAAARVVLEAALTALRRRPGTAAAAGAVEAYLDRWTRRGRSPADDHLVDAAGPAGSPARAARPAPAARPASAARPARPARPGPGGAPARPGPAARPDLEDHPC